MLRPLIIFALLLSAAPAQAGMESDYASDLLSLFNRYSSSCKLQQMDVSQADGQGKFVLKLHLDGKVTSTAEIGIKSSSILAHELAKLRRDMRTIFPECNG